MVDLGTIKAGARLVVFTHLNGILLDVQTQSFSAANAALDSLQRHNIPVILCSNKTRFEVELIQWDLRLRHPFVSESGGAIFLTRDYFPFTPQGIRHIAGLDVIDCGLPRAQLLGVLHRVAGELGVPVAGFSEMSPEEVAEKCGLDLFEANRAKMREYEEPFHILNSNPAVKSRLLRALQEAGLCCTDRGLYHTVTSGTDEGKAVNTVRSLYERVWGGVLAVGLGNGLTHLPLLRQVDLPIVVRNPAVGNTPKLLGEIPKACLSPSPGPVGWNQIMLEMARKWCGD